MDKNTYEKLDTFHSKYIDHSLPFKEAKRRLILHMQSEFNKEDVKEYWDAHKTIKELPDNDNLLLLSYVVAHPEVDYVLDSILAHLPQTDS